MHKMLTNLIAKQYFRPTGHWLQRQFYSYKKFHALKFQGVIAPNGIIISLSKPFLGKVHDQTIAKRTNLNDQLEDLNQRFGIHKENRYFVYGDKAYKKACMSFRRSKTFPPVMLFSCYLFLAKLIRYLFVRS